MRELDAHVLVKVLEIGVEVVLDRPRERAQHAGIDADRPRRKRDDRLLDGSLVHGTSRSCFEVSPHMMPEGPR